MFYGADRPGCPLLDAAVVETVATQIVNPAFIASTGFFLGQDVLSAPVGQTQRLRSS